LERTFDLFCGIDWGSEQHRVCLMDREGHVVGERGTQHSGASLTELISWLCDSVGAAPSAFAVGIEVPRGAIVETLTEHGFAVFSINPKQLDRFRDRYSPAGAKDDRRDALVLADSLRTDRHCFHAVRLDEPAIIRLRDLSRLEDDIRDELRRLNNQLHEQWHRFFPQLLKLCPSTDEPWVWDLFEAAPSHGTGRSPLGEEGREDFGPAPHPADRRRRRASHSDYATTPGCTGDGRSGQRTCPTSAPAPTVASPTTFENRRAPPETAGGVGVACHRGG
jgi:hypothetical protein